MTKLSLSVLTLALCLSGSALATPVPTNDIPTEGLAIPLTKRSNPFTNDDGTFNDDAAEAQNILTRS